MIYRPISMDDDKLLVELMNKKLSNDKKEDKFIKNTLKLIKDTKGFSILEEIAKKENCSDDEIRYLLYKSYQQEILLLEKICSQTLFFEQYKDNSVKEIFNNILYTLSEYKTNNQDNTKYDKLETNVLVIGKSGVGKSSLINYIYGKNIREEGAGKPVTKEGLHCIKYEVENLIVNLYDTWGLEANKSSTWEEQILNELKSSNEQISIKDWMHTIIYCFSASSARIEDFEINDILKPLLLGGNQVCIVITNCDIKSNKSNIEGMKSKLIKELEIGESEIIEVASVSKKKLNGSISPPFGKDKVISIMKHNLLLNIKNKLPIQYEQYIRKELDEWKEESIQLIDKKIRYLNRHIIQNDIMNQINCDLEYRFRKIKDTCKDILKEGFEYYNKLCFVLNSDIEDNANLNFDYTDENIINFSLDMSDVFLDIFSDVLLMCIPLINLFVVSDSKDITKRNLKNKVDEKYNEFNESISTMVDELKNRFKEVK